MALGNNDHVAAAFSAFTALGVTEVNVARWFGVPLVSDVRHVPSRVRASVRRGAGAWIALLVGGETVPEAWLSAPANALATLTTEGMVEVDAHADPRSVRARYAFVPMAGVWVVSDRFDAAAGELGANAVSPPDLSALQLGALLPRLPLGALALDVGCGSGALALALAQRGACVRASDVDERALELGRLGARINRVSVDFCARSLLDGAPAAAELVLFNAPLCVAPLAAGDPAEETRYYRAAGGDDLAAEFLRALPAHLAPSGEALLQVQLVPSVLAALREASARYFVLLIHFADAPDGTPHGLAWLTQSETAGQWRVHIPISAVCRRLDRRVLEALAATRRRLDQPAPLTDDERWLPADWLELRQSRQLGIGATWRATRFGVTPIDDNQLRILEALDGRTLGELKLATEDREKLRALAERGLCAPLP